MNILLIIYSAGKASGGHYHSLDQLSKELGKGIKLNVVSFGPVSSPVLTSNPFFKYHIPFAGIYNLLSLFKHLGKLIRSESISLIHCFDTESLNWMLILPSTFKIPIVLNKCGGPNPLRKNWQHADSIILFSKENFNWFDSNIHYNANDYHLIPNRVTKLDLLPIEKRTLTKDTSKINFMRVSRLGGAYEKTLWDTLKMINVLNDKFPVHLYIVGRIQDEIRFSKFVDVINRDNLPVTIITDDRASRGADFLYLADFVIGTGRSFMEALSLGIPSLTPAVNMDWPVLVLKENFNQLFSSNFSERSVADSSSKINNENRIVKLLLDNQSYLLAQEEANLLFQNYFYLKGVGEKYFDVYNRVITKERNRIKLIIKNLLYIIKTIISN
ncbi:MAG: hypothetical protein P8O16_17310 [Algoriphagus sp.]|uniref:hypothetical protein n=1 Tax=Algoriphagus sp. TaxID=1872435 RepID=UPI002614F2FC|nr:hypothetical protein [Algoriphagus sp.]MDG1279041.1 hypothetical protein [Algoriphagus sp.]